MATTSKPVLKPYVARWLDKLDACIEDREEWDEVSGRAVKRPWLMQPPPPDHTGQLHRLIEADFSPLLSRAEADAEMHRLEQSGGQVALQRKEFPVGTYWIIIKKWDRGWRKLRVIRRLDRFVKCLERRWEEYWHRHGGGRSPYSRQWIQYENLVDAHRFVYGGPDGEKRQELDKQFPAVAIMQRIENGEAARSADVEELEKWASARCQKHVSPKCRNLYARLRKLDLRAELRNEHVEELCDDVAVLHAEILAQDILARHERAMPVVDRWRRDWEQNVSPFFHFLSNEQYIRSLRKVMPLRRAGDPTLEREKRRRDAKRTSARRKSSGKAARA